MHCTLNELLVKVENTNSINVYFLKINVSDKKAVINRVNILFNNI